MITEKSCGAVIFTRIHGEIQYVIIRSREGFYGLPKGHVEVNETERETALREILEETGLRVGLIEGFCVENHYTFKVGDEIRMKHVVYFLAEYSDQEPIAQEEELSGIYLMDYESAMGVFQFENLKCLLTQAHEYIKFKCRQV